MGQSYHRDFKVGDPCFIVVDEVNTPSGIWEGEVLNVDPHEDYVSVRAKITDGRLPENVRHMLGKEPSVNYDVHPADKGTAKLVRTILQQRVNRAADISRWVAREEALLDALVRVAREFRSSMSESLVRKVLKGEV